MTPRKGGELELLAAILQDRPNLPGALCIGNHDVYDAATAGDPDALRTAGWLCRRCPHTTECPDAIGRPTPRPAAGPAPLPPATGECAYCGATLTSPSPSARYCNRACRQGAYRHRKDQAS